MTRRRELGVVALLTAISGAMLFGVLRSSTELLFEKAALGEAAIAAVEPFLGWLVAVSPVLIQVGLAGALFAFVAGALIDRLFRGQPKSAARRAATANCAGACSGGTCSNGMTWQELDVLLSSVNRGELEVKTRQEYGRQPHRGSRQEGGRKAQKDNGPDLSGETELMQALMEAHQDAIRVHRRMDEPQKEHSCEE